VGELNDLLRRFVEQGDARAMEDIVRETRPRLLRAARRIGKPQDAEDSVQAAYHALLRCGDEPMDAPLIAWLLTVVVRIAYRRKAIGKREHQLAVQLALPSDEPGPRRVAELAERSENLRAEVGRLPPHYRDAVILRYLEGLSIRECARLLDAPEETIRTRLKRARRLLRGRLHPRVAHGLLALPWWLADHRFATLGAAMKSKFAAVAILIAVAGLLYVGRDYGRADRVERTDREASVPTKSAQNESSGERAAEETLSPPVDLTTVDRDRDVHGTVVDEDGKPVAGALLELIDYPWRRARLLYRERRYEEKKGPATRSAQDGTFRIPWRRARMGWLRVSAASFTDRLLPKVQAGERLRIVMSVGATVVVVARDGQGRPVAGADVRFFHARSREVGVGNAREHRGETGADGRCVLAGVPGPSQGYLELSRRGRGWPGWTAVTVPAPGGRVEVGVEFPEGRTLRGRVADADTGAPVAGARVGFGWSQHASVTTDGEGEYVLPGWSGRGMDDIHVSHPKYGRATAVVGAQTEIDFVLRVGDRVRGRLVDPSGAAVAGARLAAIGSVHDGNDQRTSRAYGESGADGSFEIGGRRHDMFHALVVLKPGFGRVLYDFEPASRPGGVIDLGTIRLVPGRTIEGRVTDGKGRPLARVPVVLTGANDDRGRYEPRQRRQNMRYGEQEERVTDDLGRFRFPDLAQGRYALAARRDGGDRTETVVVVGDADVAGVVVEFAESRVITVSVVDPGGAPVPNAYVSSQCEGRALGGRTDANGIAILRASGPVTQLRVAYAFDGADTAAYLLPDAIARLGDDEDTVEIRLGRGTPITGVVYGPDGAALPRALVEARLGERKLAPSVTNAGGEFRVIVPPGSRVDLEFGGAADEHGLYVKKSRGGLHGVAAGQTGVALRLKEIPKDGTLVVVVLDPDGSPFMGRDVWCVYGNERSPAVRTDERGRARFDGLPRTKCSIVVVLTPEDRESLVPARAQPVVPDGQEVTLRLRNGVACMGVVKPPQRAYVMFRKVEGEKRRWVGPVQTGNDGRFRALLPADEGNGPYEVTAYALADVSQRAMVKGVTLDGPDLVIELKPPK